MPIGRGSSKKRPKNDLDDYLDEVDSRLFCVTRADRQCLHRDLKAHVRELTTDPGKTERFEGRYVISREQLVDNIGEPEDIASMYISSVGKKIPSIGLRIYMLIVMGIFLGISIMGIERIGWSAVTDDPNPGWFLSTGLVMTIGGTIGIIAIFNTLYRFERSHVVIIYLTILSALLSIPL